MAAGDEPLLPDIEPSFLTRKVVMEALGITLLFFGVVFMVAFAMFGPPHARPDLSGECVIAIFSALIVGILLIVSSR